MELIGNRYEQAQTRLTYSSNEHTNNHMLWMEIKQNIYAYTHIVPILCHKIAAVTAAGYTVQIKSTIQAVKVTRGH